MEDGLYQQPMRKRRLMLLTPASNARVSFTRSREESVGYYFDFELYRNEMTLMTTIL